MPLIRYSQFFYYPGGGEATNVPMTIHPMGGNIPIPLRADKAGTTPLPNPLDTDETGLLAFYAAPGNYCVWFAGEMWPVPVDEEEMDPAWPDLFIHHQISPAAVWTVNHWLGVRPTASVLLAGQETEADVTHPDENTTVITFGAPATGTAHLRR